MTSIVDPYVLFLNFIAHILIFIGTSYVVLHNRNLPKWHATPLWYIGLSSFACAISIMCQWGLGTTSPFSYENIGLITETALNITLAATATIFLTITVRQDLKGSKQRRNS